MSSLASFTYVLPVHNQESVLRGSVSRVRARLAAHPGSEVILVENGSSDGSAALCRELAGSAADPGVVVRSTTSQRGLGFALRRGMELARGDIVVLTAADLPFGFTDLDAVLQLQPLPDLVIGSKAHQRSATEVALQRRLMSMVFRVARRVVLGQRVGDSQGTIFMSRGLSEAVLPNLRCGGFLISTEVICWAQRLGASVVEVPVAYRRSAGSTVSPLRDSLAMLTGLFRLRRRLHARPAHRISHQLR